MTTTGGFATFMRLLEPMHFSAAFIIPATAWFIVLDPAAAYIPMAWISLSIATRPKPGAPT